MAGDDRNYTLARNTSLMGPRVEELSAEDQDSLDDVSAPIDADTSMVSLLRGLCAPKPDPTWDIPDLFEDDRDDLVLAVTENRAPDTMVCFQCSVSLECDEEPVGVFTFPVQWRWTCPQCGYEEIVSEDVEV